jgi:hypothetical protein
MDRNQWPDWTGTGGRITPEYANGHHIIDQYVRIPASEYVQEADILSRAEQAVFVTEVKISLMGHRLQTGLGQLLLHKYGCRSVETARFQLAVPGETREDRHSPELVEFLRDHLGLSVVFIP